MPPTIGRIVIYKLGFDDVEYIRRRRNSGHVAEHGNSIAAGDEFPMIVVRVLPDEFGPSVPGINGQLFLDGNDRFWVTGKAEGTENGTWHWPERV